MKYRCAETLTDNFKISDQPTQILYIIQSNPEVLKTCKGKRAVKAESFHLELFAKIPRLKKCKTKISDGQPAMYIDFDYIPLLA